MIFNIRYALMVIATSIIMFVWWIGVYSRINDSITKYKSKIIEFKNRDTKEESVQLFSYEKTNKINYLIDQISYPISWMLDCAAKNGLTLVELKPEKLSPESCNKLLKLILMSFSFRGTFIEFIKFCNCTSQAPYLIEIKDCKIDVIGSNLLSIFCTFKFILVDTAHE